MGQRERAPHALDLGPQSGAEGETVGERTAQASGPREQCGWGSRGRSGARSLCG